MLKTKMNALVKNELESAIKSHIDSLSLGSQYAVSVKLEEDVLAQITCKGVSSISIPANLDVSLSHNYLARISVKC